MITVIINTDSTLIKLQTRLEIALFSKLEYVDAITLTKILLQCALFSVLVTMMR